MRKFGTEEVALAYQLEQLLYDFAEELDLNDGVNAGSFYTEDAVFDTGTGPVKGRQAIQAFHDTRTENIRKHQKDGTRTNRHAFLNVRCHIHDDHHATLYFTNVNYAGEGKAPVLGLQGPSAVADCRMECRRQPDGNWQFSECEPKLVLLGEDDFRKKMLALTNK